MKKTHSIFDIFNQNATYSHTDLAYECPKSAKNSEGTIYKEYSIGKYDVSELSVVTEDGQNNKDNQEVLDTKPVPKPYI